MVDISLTPYNTYNDPSALAQLLLEAMLEASASDYACVLSTGENMKHLEQIAQAGSTGQAGAVFGLLKGHLRDATPVSDAALVEKHDLAASGYGSALIVPLAMPDEILGVLGLFSTREQAYDPTTMTRIGPKVALVRTLLENVYMYHLMAQNLIVTQSIQLAAREIADNPSPQHVVNILRDYFFDAHVTSCALLLYGPMQEDRPNGPFEYIEVKGTWSRRRGSGVGVGLRFYLHDQPDLVEQLDREEILIFPRAKELTLRLDPLLRVFLQAERVRSICLLGLRASHRKLGVIFIGTDKRHDFTTQELHSYRTVSEFMAVNVMTQTLQQQHDRVQQGRAALLDAVTDGVLMVMPGAGGTRVLTLNGRFTELFDLPEANYQDWLLADLLDQLPFPEGQRQELRKKWLSIPVRDPSIPRGEFHLINQDGGPVDVEWYSAPVYQNQTVLGRIYIFHDVTAERTAQRLRSAFLSRVSHELRTPLTSIRGFAEFILEATGDQLPDLAREYTEIILSSAKHLNRIFTDMIELTRADAGELKLNRQEALIPDIIIDVAARMELQYKQRDQQVVMDLDDDLPAVSVDIDRMIQVLQNLFTNAIKYSPAGGTIRISTDYAARPDALPGGAPNDVLLPAVVVSVTDDGAGLTKEQAERVFMPFYRTDEAKKQKIEGVGLGLAVTRSIVEMHRGKIWAEPPPTDGKGGRFHFTLPTIERRDEGRRE